MTHCRAIIIASSLGLAGGLAGSATAVEPPTLRRFECAETHMGTEIRLVFYAADDATAQGAAAAAFARVADLDRKLSDYDPHSELSLLGATSGSGRRVRLSADLWHVLDAGQRLAAETDGAFDVTVGPLTKMWRSARRTKTFPPADRMAKARAAVGYRCLLLDPGSRTAELTRPNMRLDLGGIAMGYAAHEALAVLKRHGIASALVDASGDVVCSAAPPDEPQGWRIGIAPLTGSPGSASRSVWLRDAALTTSGDAFQYVEIDGRRFSHIVDPKTGLGLTMRSSVTVTARDGMTADSMATAVSVLGPRRGLELIAGTPGAAALIVVATADGVKEFASPDFGTGPPSP